MANISPNSDSSKNETADNAVDITANATASAPQRNSDPPAENPKTPDSAFAKLEDSKEQRTAAAAADSTVKDSSTIEGITSAQLSDTNTTPSTDTIDTSNPDDCRPKSDSAAAPASTIPELTASEVSESPAVAVINEDTATSQNRSDQRKAELDSDSKIAAADDSAVKSVRSETATSVDSAAPGTVADSAATGEKSSVAAAAPSADEDKQNDTMEKAVHGTDGEAKSDVGVETANESTVVDDKEISSDDADQFVDAKSTAQIDGTSGADAESSGETKERSEAVQDEEEYEYDDDEEQEAEPDDDEIEGNPAYIPKSGRYYMHDSRNTDEERTTEQSSRSRADGKWKHDRFDERSQRPKTRRELMNRYGYDIRSEGNNSTGDGNTNSPAAHTNRTRGTPRGDTRGGYRAGPYSNRAPPSQQHQQQGDRRDDRRQVHNAGSGRPTGRGGRRGERHPGGNSHREQPGTRVFKNSPMNAQRGTSGGTNRTDNHRSYGRGGDGRVRENRRGGGGARGGGGGAPPPPIHDRNAHTGGKRYSTQRLATNYVPENQPPQAVAPGPIPIPPPDWRSPPPPPPPAAFQGPPPTSAPPPPPPPVAVPAPVPNFRSSDIVYFDPQPQQLYRNPIPPRAKKRLEIVPPYQAKNSN